MLPSLLVLADKTADFDMLLAELEHEGEEIEEEILEEIGILGSGFGKWKPDGQLVFRDSEVSLIYGAVIGASALLIFCNTLPGYE